MKEMTNNLAICVDFDGTVTRRDVGYHIFHKFSGGRNDAVLPDWKAGRITTRECFRREAALARGSAEDILDYVDTFEIDSTFPQFVDLCASEGIPLAIVSDGMEFYIRRLLERDGLGHLQVFANQGLLKDNAIEVLFPWENRSCDRCGSCKAERIGEFKQQSGRGEVVFVGDGYSDVCATRVAQVLFAKKDLEEYCRANNIDYRHYDTFADVSRTLREIQYLP
ncbi:MAG: MtnX-like HAD-IB family phosphatase [Candidatus Zixiibacteriota bacterium]